MPSFFFIHKQWLCLPTTKTQLSTSLFHHVNFWIIPLSYIPTTLSDFLSLFSFRNIHNHLQCTQIPSSLPPFPDQPLSLKMIKLTFIFILGIFISLVLYVVNNSPAALLIDIMGPTEFFLMVIQMVWEMLLSRAHII